jgi:hypothetical protein
MGLLPFGVLLTGGLALRPVSFALLHLVAQLFRGPIQNKTNVFLFAAALLQTVLHS